MPRGRKPKPIQLTLSKEEMSTILQSLTMATSIHQTIMRLPQRWPCLSGLHSDTKTGIAKTKRERGLHAPFFIFSLLPDKTTHPC